MVNGWTFLLVTFFSSAHLFISFLQRDLFCRVKVYAKNRDGEEETGEGESRQVESSVQRVAVSLAARRLLASSPREAGEMREEKERKKKKEKKCLTFAFECTSLAERRGERKKRGDQECWGQKKKNVSVLCNINERITQEKKMWRWACTNSCTCITPQFI